MSRKDLKERVRILEDAVRELQEAVVDLAAEPDFEDELRLCLGMLERVKPVSYPVPYYTNRQLYTGAGWGRTRR
jgi:hypothetical protein